MWLDDTIVAISSAVGPAARIVVRLSGPQAASLAAPTLSGAALPPRQWRRVRVSAAGLNVPARAVRFAAPASYSGDETIELHLPGSAILARRVVEDLIAAGARAAQPGEFTARAFFNGKLDLSAAEGVAALIDADSRAAFDAARRLAEGELARRLRPLMDELADLLALVEAGIDFSDEGIVALPPADAVARIAALDEALRGLLERSGRFDAAAPRPRVVLIGRPNAGKSTLLNALCGFDRAVVAADAGTTRDVLSATVALEEGCVDVLDAAGLEEPALDPRAGAAAAADPAGRVTEQMRAQALRAAAEAEVLVLVREIADLRPDPPLPREADLLVLSKADLASPGEPADDAAALRVSARSGEGLPRLRRAINDRCFAAARHEALTLNARHLDRIRASRQALARAAQDVPAGEELLAADLRAALDALGDVLGLVTPDDVLGRVFAGFCIGK